MNYRIKLLIATMVFGSFAGVIYMLINDDSVDINSVIVGAPLGLGFWLIEFGIFSRFQKRLDRLNFLVLILFKTVTYTFIIYLVSLILQYLYGYVKGYSIEEFKENLLTIDVMGLVAYTLVLYSLFSFYLQIDRLLGEGKLFKFVSGRYRRPNVEYRFFMFLDMKGASALAESLGRDRYYELLNDFFHDISVPVRTTSAEIYQYVGDEVVLTWETEEGVRNSNCVEIYFMMEQRIRNKSGYYQSKYGIVPEFKAGLHYGEVISALIGDIKQEIVYNGDVLNTASRIQEMCNKLNSKLLTSTDALDKLRLPPEYIIEVIDELTLRGKKNPVIICRLDLPSDSGTS